MPLMTTRMKEPSQFLRQRIDAGKIRTFKTITIETGEREIGIRRTAAVLSGDDVVDFKIERRMLLSKPTVFASVSRSRPNQLDLRRVHAISGKNA